VRRPLLWASLSFLAGVATGPSLGPALVYSAFAASLGLAVVSVWGSGRGRVAAAVLLACAAGVGATAGALSRSPPGPRELAAHVGERVEVEGLAATDGSQFVLDSVRVLVPAGLRGHRVLVRGKTKVAVGDRVRVRGKLLPLPEARNPGEPEPARFLYRERVRAVLAADRVVVLDSGRGYPVLRWAAELRKALQAVYGRVLPPPLDAVLAGVVLGIPIPDRSLQQAFRDSGLVHLLVASGAQLSAVGAAVYLALRRFRRTVRSVAALAAVLGFAVVAGWEPSMARAAVMAAVTVAAGLSRREVDPPTLLGLAAAVLVAAHPLLLWDVGFQLSFAATAALLFVSPALRQHLPLQPPWVREGVAAAVSCQVFVLPLLLWHFGHLQPWAVAANVLALPAAAFLVPVGLLGGLVGLVWVPAAVPLLRLAQVGCAYLVWVARTVADFPLATVRLPEGKAAAALLAVGVGAGVAAWRGWVRPSRGIVAAVVALAVAVWGRALPPPPYAEVVFLDVGQGDAVVIRSPEGHRVLLDGGPEAEPVTGFLARSGGRVDVAVLSHPHADHVTGLTHALRSFGAGLVLEPGYPHPTPSYAEFLRTVRERGIPYRVGRRGMRVELGRGATLEVLWPPEPLWEGPSAVNENSLVVVLRYGDVRFLFPGDVEAGAEGSLVASGGDLRAEVLKVPHQGSRTSSSEEFLSAVAPRVAVLSVGKANPYGHPHRDVLARYARLGVSLYRTDRDGAVTIRTDGRSLWVKTVKPGWCCTAWWTAWRTR